MIQEETKYKPLVYNITPVYRFIDGDNTEEFWADAQNCAYYTYNNSKFSKETNLFDGKNWWILWPYIPENVEPKSVTYETYEQEIENIEYDEDGDISTYTSNGVYNKVVKTEEIYGYLNENNEYI